MKNASKPRDGRVESSASRGATATSSRRCGLLALAGAWTVCGATTPSVPDLPAPTARCDDNRIEITQPLAADELYIDWAYLDLITAPPINPNTRGRERLGGEPIRRVVDYLLKKRLIALETSMPKGFRWERASGEVARVALWPVGSPTCLPSPYPLQEIPTFRRRGVSSEQCVGLEWLSAPSASVRIQATTTTAFESPRFRLLRFDVVGGQVGASGRIQPTLRVVDHIGQTRDLSTTTFSREVAICPDRGAALAAVDAAITGPEQPVIHERPEVIVPMPEHASSDVARGLPAMPQDRFARLQWLETSREYKGRGSLYLIDQRGEMWVDARRAQGMEWAFHVVQRDRIVVTALPREDVRVVYSMRAFARTPAGGYAVVVQRLHEEDLGRLFEFDKDLSLTASFSLTAEQVRAASVEAQREPR